jgi:superfamily II DNA or RNA helicase
MTTPAERALAIMKDARFKQGRKCLKEKNYEDSIEIFSSLVQSWYEMVYHLRRQSNH